MHSNNAVILMYAVCHCSSVELKLIDSTGPNDSLLIGYVCGAVLDMNVRDCKVCYLL